MKTLPILILWIMSVARFSTAASCSGGIFHSNEEMQGLKTCTKITGPLIVTGSNYMDLSSLIPLVTEITGDFAVFSAQNTKVSNLSLTTIGGSFLVSGSGMLSIDGLTKLKSVGGHFNVTNNDNLATIDDFPALTSIGGDIVISGNRFSLNQVGSFSPLLTAAKGDVRVVGNINLNANTIGFFDHLVTISGNLILSTGNQVNEFRGLGRLTSIGGTFTLDTTFGPHSYLGTQVLQTIGGDFITTPLDAPPVVSYEFPALETVRSISLGQSSSISFPMLKSAKDFKVSSVSGTIEFPELTTVSGNFLLYAGTAEGPVPYAVSSLLLPKLEQVNYLNLNYLSKLTQLALPALQQASEVSITSAQDLQAVSLDALQTINYLTLSANPLLNDIGTLSKLDSASSIFINETSLAMCASMRGRLFALCPQATITVGLIGQC